MRPYATVRRRCLKRVPGCGSRRGAWRCWFETADVTVAPLPGAPADLVYARLVLAHLPDPRATAETWQASLRRGGAVLIEDLEEIDAPAGPLRAYDDLAVAVVRGSGGSDVRRDGPCRARRVVHTVTVPTTVAARIYQFNLRRWWAAPPPGVSREQLEELHAELETLAATDESATLSWIVRQLVLNA